MFTGTNQDRRGVARGACKNCPEGCEEYSQPISRDSCDYCGCPAGHHSRLPARPDLVIKVKEEPKEDCEAEGRMVVPSPARSRAPPFRPQAGPSRRTHVQMGGVGDGISHSIAPRNHTKRCKELFEDDGVSYDNLVLDDKQLGIFAIKYNSKVIYVGEPKKTPLKTNIRSIFKGGSNQDISKLIRCLRDVRGGDKARHLKVAWIKQMKEDPHAKTCKEGKRQLSYRQCISRRQGRNPRDILMSLLEKYNG